ncbi:MAG: hypothetical protein GY826_01750 [Fuerstiella sp.]|nr:hypothetical protein [Fuerstiella sp.]
MASSMGRGVKDGASTRRGDFNGGGHNVLTNYSSTEIRTSSDFENIRPKTAANKRSRSNSVAPDGRAYCY